MKVYSEEELFEKIERGDRIAWMQDGECTGYRLDAENEYAFTVKVISTGQEFGFNKPFTTEIRNGGLYIIWEVSNGQLVGLPITKEAMREAGSLWVIE